MDIYEMIRKRVSTRVYKSEKVPDDTVKRVVEASLRAPSWGNKQCWKVIIVDSKVEKNLIGKASGQPNISKACEEAPYVIVYCANPKESGVKNGMEYYLFDCALAMDHLMLAAESEGLATCIVGWFDEKIVKSVLNIPDNYRVVAYTPLGYAAENVLPRSRKEFKETVYHNQWKKEMG